MKRKSFIVAAILFGALSVSSAQVVIKNGDNKIEVKGKDVTISSGSKTAGQSSGNIVITGSGKEKETYDGNGKEVTISGSNHDIRITGYPNKITLSGSNNAVYTDGAKSIYASGSNNAVQYYNLINKKKPAIYVSGHNNTVAKATL